MPLDQVLMWIEGHIGLMALLTAIASFLLFVEARASRMRSEAVLEAVPDLYAQGTILAVVVVNSGPAIARDVSLTVTLRHPADPTQTSQHQMDRRALPVGQTLLMPRVRGKARPLRELADAGFVLELKWRWTDARRFLWIGPRWRHERHERYSTFDVFEGLRTSGLLVSPTSDLDLMIQRTVTRPVEALSKQVAELAAALRHDRPRS